MDKEKKPGFQQVHVATVQLVLVGCPTEAHAADLVSEMLRPLTQEIAEGTELVGLLDWAYLKTGAQRLTPTEEFVPNPYEEGDAFP